MSRKYVAVVDYDDDDVSKHDCIESYEMFEDRVMLNTTGGGAVLIMLGHVKLIRILEA